MVLRQHVHGRGLARQPSGAVVQADQHRWPIRVVLEPVADVVAGQPSSAALRDVDHRLADVVGETDGEALETGDRGAGRERRDRSRQRARRARLRVPGGRAETGRQEEDRGKHEHSEGQADIAPEPDREGREGHAQEGRDENARVGLQPAELVALEAEQGLEPIRPAQVDRQRAGRDRAEDGDSERAAEDEPAGPALRAGEGVVEQARGQDRERDEAREDVARALGLRGREEHHHDHRPHDEEAVGPRPAGAVPPGRHRGLGQEHAPREEDEQQDRPVVVHGLAPSECRGEVAARGLLDQAVVEEVGVLDDEGDEPGQDEGEEDQEIHRREHAQDRPRAPLDEMEDREDRGRHEEPDRPLDQGRDRARRPRRARAIGGAPAPGLPRPGSRPGWPPTRRASGACRR